jgi:hypothetical protein
MFSFLRERFREKPEPEKHLAVRVDHLQLPLGISRQAFKNVPAKVTADGCPLVPRGAVVGQVHLLARRTGFVASANLKMIERHLPMIKRRSGFVCSVSDRSNHHGIAESDLVMPHFSALCAQFG